MNRPKNPLAPFEKMLITGGVIGVSILLLSTGLFSTANSGSPFIQSLNGLFALDTQHVWWYIARSAGLMAYLLFWLSTIWGFSISSKVLDPFLERTFTYDFHEHLSLLALGFIFLHIIVLMFDTYQPLNLLQILIPFTSTYRPFWVGVGTLTLYIAVLVTATFYLRTKISMQTFRSIHYLSVAGYVGAFLHSLFSGTDSILTWVQMMYWGTFLVTLFFCARWLVALFRKIALEAKITQAVRK